MTISTGLLYVVTDAHGHRAELRDALFEAGLVDGVGDWSGGSARLWFLGDYVDRGPDGIGVIDDVRRWAGQAAVTGGQVGALLGNHEVQLLGADRFGSSPLPGGTATGGFLGAWRSFGGNDRDLSGLTDEHRAWMLALPAVALVDGHLLVHSDTTRYLEFGSSVAQINAAVATAMETTDPQAWLAFNSRLTDRGRFKGPTGAAAAAQMLDTLGGERIVHGHSTLITHFGLEAEQVTDPVTYADGLVVAIDGGVFEGGRILLRKLPFGQDHPA